MKKLLKPIFAIAFALPTLAFANAATQTTTVDKVKAATGAHVAQAHAAAATGGGADTNTYLEIGDAGAGTRLRAAARHQRAINALHRKRPGTLASPGLLGVVSEFGK